MVPNKQGFLILVHTNPEQVKRLIKRLDHPRSVFFVHVDRKSELSAFEIALSEFDIHWVKRERAQWGSGGILRAMMNGLRQANKLDSNMRVTLLSGADYPLVSIEEIMNEFDEKKSVDFMNLVSFEKSGWPDDKKLRIKKHYFFINNNIYEYPKNPKTKSLFRNCLNGLFSIFLPKERKFPEGLIPYGGDMWFSFSANTIDYIVSFDQSRPDLLSYMMNCICSDEIYLHTVQGNRSKKNHQVHIEPSLTYTFWPDPNQPHPKILDMSDVFNLEESGCLFARKFEHGSEILDYLDQKANQSMPSNSSFS